jgi:hypothetical protein
MAEASTSALARVDLETPNYGLELERGSQRELEVQNFFRQTNQEAELDKAVVLEASRRGQQRVQELAGCTSPVLEAQVHDQRSALTPTDPAWLDHE